MGSFLNRHTNPAMKTQRQKLNDRQGKNDAGGYAYKIGDFDKLQRFLILGSEGGTYYVNESKLTERNLKALDKCLKEDGIKVVDMAVQVSTENRAPKNDQAILAIAKASVSKDVDTRKAAFSALRKVCRTGTHLFQFMEFRKHFGGGWGRSMAEAVSGWYLNRPTEKMALQVAKYKQRDGWSARDAVRLAHPRTDDKDKNAILKWVVSKGEYNEKDLPAFLGACNAIKEATPAQAAKLIRKHQLPREVVPTAMLNEVKVWEALLENMPMTAMIRNLGKMSKLGILGPNSEQAMKVCDQLTTEEALKNARVHPINILMAMQTYKQGRGLKGSLTWPVNQAIVGAMEDAFYLSFGAVEPTGKRTMLGLDVSYSMSQPVMGNPLISACMASTAMAMTTVRTEKHRCYTMGFCHEFVDLKITKNDSLEQAMKKAQKSNFGGTDAAVPMIHAAKKKIPVEAFIIFTDNDTWAGNKHASVALEEYRQKMGLDSKLIVCATSSTGFSIADPEDMNSLDICGFDAATPRIISEFSKGNI